MMKRQVHVDELKQYSLFIGTPMYGGQCRGSFTKLVLTYLPCALLMVLRFSFTFCLMKA